jgi:hypothetical protein
VAGGSGGFTNDPDPTVEKTGLTDIVWSDPETFWGSELEQGGTTSLSPFVFSFEDYSEMSFITPILIYLGRSSL